MSDLRAIGVKVSTALLSTSCTVCEWFTQLKVLVLHGYKENLVDLLNGPFLQRRCCGAPQERHPEKKTP